MANFISNLIANITNQAPGMGVPSRWLDGYCLVVDTSHYQSYIDWAALKAANIAMLWAKCSEGCTSIDDRFAATAQEAYDNDIPLGAYHFFDPSYLCGGGFGEKFWPPFNTDPTDLTTRDQDPQLLNLKKALRFKKFYAISIDLERYWVDYAEYYANPQTCRRVTPTWIAATFERFCDAVRKTWPDKEVYIYSRKSFIDEFCPDLFTVGWFENNHYPIWTAQYFQPSKSLKTTWAEIKAKYLPPDTVNPIVWGASKWDFWQWTGDVFLLDGFKDGPNLSAVDISLYNGTVTHLWDRLGFTPRQAPVTEPVEVDPPTPTDPVTPVTEPVEVPTDQAATLATIARQVAEIRSFFKA